MKCRLGKNNKKHKETLPFFKYLNDKLEKA
jgi:hypothetical protein